MDIEIIPKSLKGSIEAITSKSAAHRHIIAASLCRENTKLEINKLSEDIAATLSCLEALGASYSVSQKLIEVTPIKKVTRNTLIDCKESGTTLRLMLPLIGALGGCSSITGSGRLPERPIKDLKEALEKGGLAFSSAHLPFKVIGTLKGATYEIPGNISSQYISGLLFALPLLKEDSKIILTSPLQSAGYVDMTLEVLREYGITIGKSPSGYEVPGGQEYKSPGVISLEGDWSNGAFYITAGVLNGHIAIDGLDSHSTQRDKEIIDILSLAGANIIKEDKRIIAQHSVLKAQEIDVSEIPDLLPVLAVAASLSEGTTFFKNAARLRLKESDRLFSTASMLKSLGGIVDELPSGLIIKGVRSLRGGITESFGDHRIAMAAAVAATLCRDRVIIRNAEAINKSYPRFFEDYRSLGGEVHVLNDR